VVQSVAAGQMKAYGITSKAASPQFPGVASFVDALGPKLEIFYWHALFAPAGTPKGVIDKLSGVLLAVLDDPAIIKAWAETGVAPFGKDQRTPQAAQKLMQNEIARWSQVVRENNIKPAE
jgi:tripartite-type tricarboxylate transporter receptor subunit TctC